MRRNGWLKLAILFCFSPLPLPPSPFLSHFPTFRLLSCLVLSCLVLSCLVLSCFVLSCLVLSCLVMLCFVVLCFIPYRIVAHRVISVLILSYLILIAVGGQTPFLTELLHRVTGDECGLGRTVDVILTSFCHRFGRSTITLALLITLTLTQSLTPSLTLP